MTSSIKTIIYPVKDLARAKAMYGALLGVPPSSDAPYYVGFTVAGQGIGLDPHGHTEGMMAYVGVDDIESSLRALLDAGAVLLQAVRDVGGNIIGLSQSA